MTVSSTVARSGPYQGNGVAVTFGYGFKIESATHLTVVRTVSGVDTIIDPSAYSVTNVGNEGGGSIIFTLAPAVGQAITIIRNVPFTQETDLENQGAYYADTVEDALDLAVMRDQQLEERLDRSVQIPVGADPSVLPGVVQDVLRLADSADNIDIVANNIGSVNTVSPHVAAIETVAPHVGAIDTVAPHVTAIETVAPHVAAVETVAANVVDVTNFADVYQGPKTTDPTTRNDGSALHAGDLYFNTSTKLLRVYDGAFWRDASAQSLNVVTKSFTGNGAQTAFLLDASPAVPGNVLVEIGGVLQVPAVDYVVAGSTLTFTSAPANGVAINTWVLFTVSTLNAPADGTSIWPVSTKAGVKAFPTSRVTLSYDGSLWDWKLGDFSAVAAIDTVEGSIVASTGVSVSVGAWVRRKNDGWYDPRWFGADPLGVASSSSAFQIALNLGPVKVGPGTFRFTSQVLVNGKSMTMHGSGFQSVIVGDTADAIVLRHVPTAGAHIFDLKDFVMSCGRAPVAGQLAIHIDGSSQVTAATDPNGRNITGERTLHRGIVDGVHFLSTDYVNNGWTNGLRVTSLLNYIVRNSIFIGKTGTRLGEAYAFDGNGICVDIDFSSIWVFNANIGLNLPDYVEGIYAHSYKFLNVTYGVFNRFQPGRSVLSLSLCGSSQLQFGPGHVNATTFCMAFDNAPFLQVKNNLFILSPDAGQTGTAAGVYLSIANLCAIKDNQLYSVLQSGLISYGTILYKVTNSSVVNNDGNGFGYGVMLIQDCVNNLIADNDNYSGDTVNYPYCVYTQPSNGNIKNRYARNVSGGNYAYRGTGTDGANYYEPVTYSAPVSVTVTAAAFTDVSIPVPDIFSQVDAPTFATVDGGLGTKIFGQYSRAASTKTSLSFRMQNVDSSAMTAGAVACFMHAVFVPTPQP